MRNLEKCRNVASLYKMQLEPLTFLCATAVKNSRHVFVKYFRMSKETLCNKNPFNSSK